MALRSAKQVIHIVDDDPNVRDSLEVLLKFMGYVTYVYSSGAAFLAQNAFTGTDILLFDLYMPDMDGFRLYKHIYHQGHDNVALLMTGHGGPEVEREARQRGFCTVLHKPFSEIQLRTALDQALAAAR